MNTSPMLIAFLTEFYLLKNQYKHGYIYVCVCILAYIPSQNKHIYPAKIFVLLIKEK